MSELSRKCVVTDCEMCDNDDDDDDDDTDMNAKMTVITKNKTSEPVKLHESKGLQDESVSVRKRR